MKVWFGDINIKNKQESRQNKYREDGILEQRLEEPKNLIVRVALDDLAKWWGRSC